MMEESMKDKVIFIILFFSIVILIISILFLIPPDILKINTSVNFSNSSNEIKFMDNTNLTMLFENQQGHKILQDGFFYDTKLIVDREIEIFNNGSFCIKSAILNNCTSIDNLYQYSNLKYDKISEYSVLFDYSNNPSTIYIINNDYKSNPKVMVIGLNEIYNP